MGRAAQVEKSGGKSGGKSGTEGTKVHRRFKPGTVAKREAARAQRSIEKLLQRIPFQRLVKNSLGDLSDAPIRFQRTALLHLQLVVERRLVDYSKAAKCVSTNAKRVTIKTDDFTTVHNILDHLHVTDGSFVEDKST